MPLWPLALSLTQEFLWVYVSVPCGTIVNNPSANAGDSKDWGSIPGLGRCPRVRNGNPLQYSCLQNSVDRESWRSTVHGVSKCWTWLNTQHTYKCHPRYSLPLVRGLCQLENHPWHIPELKLLLVLSDSGFREPDESQYLFCQAFPKLYPFSLLACYNLWITYDSNAIFTLRVYCS